MYCENCKHWKQPNHKMGECLKTINDWREGVGTMSPNGWEGGMYTGPRFGCVHFEEDDREETEEEWSKREGNYTTDEMNGEEITR